MGIIKLVSEGSWWLHSEKDPRWNYSDRDIVGGFVMPMTCEAKIKELEEKFGKQPDDLEYGYMKD